MFLKVFDVKAPDASVSVLESRVAAARSSAHESVGAIVVCRSPFEFGCEAVRHRDGAPARRGMASDKRAQPAAPRRAQTSAQQAARDAALARFVTKGTALKPG